LSGLASIDAEVRCSAFGFIRESFSAYSDVNLMDILKRRSVVDPILQAMIQETDALCFSAELRAVDALYAFLRHELPTLASVILCVYIQCIRRVDSQLAATIVRAMRAIVLRTVVGRLDVQEFCASLFVAARFFAADCTAMS
jgi:hypothetical protein